MGKKKFMAEFKAEALKGNKMVNELISEFEVHTSKIQNWKKMLLDESKKLFSGKKEKAEGLSCRG